MISFGQGGVIERRLLEQILDELKEIRFLLCPHLRHRVQQFIITQTTGEPGMALQSVAPGFNPQYTAATVPVGATLNPTQPVPTWTSSDTTNAPITSVDPTGLIATVGIPASATVGTSFTLTVSYQNLDGTVATGTLSQTIVAAPPADVTGFTISQTA